MPIVYDASVDYVTTTWPYPLKSTPLPDNKTIIAWAEKRAQSHDATFWVKTWAWQGYIGWQVGPVCWGQKVDSTIVRASGAAAQDWIESGLPIGHNVSRLDLQCTVWGDFDIDNAIARHNESAIAHRSGLEGRPYAIRLVKSYGDGDTLYLGSRTSQIFVRLYNKEKESGGEEFYKGALRFEVELKNETATQIANRVKNTRAQSSTIVELLAGFLSTRGVLLPVGGNILGSILVFSRKERGDLQASLLWLEQQVSPTVRKLIREGYKSEVMQALGLGEKD